jgi:ADP-ribosyl-[dinitrogen reductase] hydrolase
MLTGSCLCGRLAYEADATLDAVIHCHCETCRKTHGSAFSSVAAVPRDAFRWVRGEEVRKAFESSPGKFRYFCGECGSHVAAERTERATVLLRLGCLDTEATCDRQMHIWRSDGASWYDPKAAWPEYPQGTPPS